MANYFSDHYTVNTPTDTLGLAPDSPRIKVPAGKKHATDRVSIATIDLGAVTNPAIGEICRMLTMKSSDRLFELFITNSGNTTTAGDIGLYLTGANSDGAVADVDLFDAALDLTTGTRVDVFTGASLPNSSRGKPLWELLGLSADPNVQYDVAITFTAVGTEDLFVAEARYASGGN